MNCKKCGAILAPDVKFCANCGSSVEGDAQTAQLQGEYPSSFVTLTPKPKSRIKPVAIAAGAVAAVGVIGAVIGLNFQSGIKQTFMGKEKYARSVLDNTVETFVGAPSSAATGAAKKLGGTVLRTVAVMDECSSDEEFLLYAASGFADAFGESGISLELGLDVQPSEKILDAICDEIGYNMDMDKDDAQRLVEYLANAYIGFAHKSADDAQMFAVSTGSGDECLINASFAYDSDGSAYMMFPDASATALHAELPELPEFDAQTVPEIDEKAIDELVASVSEVIDKYYEEAEIEIGNDVLSAGRAEYEGKCVEAVFNNVQLADMLAEMADAVADSQLVEELFVFFDEDISEFVEGAEYAADELRADEEFTLALRSYVTNTDKVIGTEVELGNDYAVVTISALDAEDCFAVAFSVDSEYEGDCFEVSVIGQKESKTSGVVTFEYLMPYYGASVDLEITYSDLAVVECGGAEYLTGTFVYEPDSAFVNLTGLNEETIYIADEEYELGRLLKNSAFIVKSSKEGDGIRFDIGLDNEEIGYYGVYYSFVSAADKISVEFRDAVDVDDIYTTDGAEFVEEVGNYYIDKLLDIDAFGGIFDSLGVNSREEFLQQTIGCDDISDYIEELGEMINNSEYAAHTIMTHPVEY